MRKSAKTSCENISGSKECHRRRPLLEFAEEIASKSLTGCHSTGIALHVRPAHTQANSRPPLPPPCCSSVVRSVMIELYARCTYEIAEYITPPPSPSCSRCPLPAARCSLFASPSEATFFFLASPKQRHHCSIGTTWAELQLDRDIVALHATSSPRLRQAAQHCLRGYSEEY